MSIVPNSAWVRGYVLNSLEDGPVRVADLIRFGEAEFGFSLGEIQAAGQHFAVIPQDRDGELYWMRPANLFAIWWGLRPDEADLRCDRTRLRAWPQPYAVADKAEQCYGRTSDHRHARGEENDETAATSRKH